MIPLQKAKSIIQKHIFMLEAESVSLSDAGNRVLAEDIIATFPSPQFNNSAMDGFAVRSADTKGASPDNPITLKVVSISSAGSPSDIDLESGECSQCMTGAKIPVGADAIIMVEDSSGFSDSVRARLPPFTQ